MTPPVRQPCFAISAPVSFRRASHASIIGLRPVPLRSRTTLHQQRCSRRARVVPTAQARPPTGQNDTQGQKVADVVLRVVSFLQGTNGQFLLWAGLVWLVLTGRAGFLFDSFLFLMLFVSVVPIVGIFLFRWWVSRQMVHGECPNCGSAITGMRGKPFQCFSCGTVVKGDGKGDFSWGTDASSATIDVDAKSVD